MKTVQRQLYDYVDAQKDGEHMTRRGVIFSAPDFDYLQAEYKWVDTEDRTLSVCFFCPMRTFVKALGIKKMSDIDTIVPAQLMELYYEGLAEIVCFVSLEYMYCMCFKKLGSIIVVENDRGFKHRMPLFEKVETPDQFLAYAEEYYKLMECNEN